MYFMIHFRKHKLNEYTHLPHHPRQKSLDLKNYVAEPREAVQDGSIESSWTPPPRTQQIYSYIQKNSFWKRPENYLNKLLHNKKWKGHIKRGRRCRDTVSPKNPPPQYSNPHLRHLTISPRSKGLLPTWGTQILEPPPKR